MGAAGERACGAGAPGGGGAPHARRRPRAAAQRHAPEAYRLQGPAFQPDLFSGLIVRSFAPVIACMSIMTLWFKLLCERYCACICRRLLAAAARIALGRLWGHEACSSPTRPSAQPQACPQGPPSHRQTRYKTPAAQLAPDEASLTAPALPHCSQTPHPALPRRPLWAQVRLSTPRYGTVLFTLHRVLTTWSVSVMTGRAAAIDHFNNMLRCTRSDEGLFWCSRLCRAEQDDTRANLLDA